MYVVKLKILYIVAQLKTCLERKGFELDFILFKKYNIIYIYIYVCIYIYTYISQCSFRLEIKVSELFSKQDTERLTQIQPQYLFNDINNVISCNWTIGLKCYEGKESDIILRV